MVRILGIDPGSRITGYGLIDVAGQDMGYVACGTIRVAGEKAFSRRLLIIGNGLEGVLREHAPSVAAVEDVFMASNPRSALKLGQARGAAVVTVLRSGIEVHAYTPRKVKQAVAGYGQATKSQVQYMVQSLLELDRTPSSDAADALAIAICHAHHLAHLHIAAAAGAAAG